MVSLLIEAYSFLIFVYVILSWIPEVRYQSWYRTLGSLTEPYLSLFRRIIPPLGMVDFSPVVALIVLMMLGEVFRRSGL